MFHSLPDKPDVVDEMPPEDEGEEGEESGGESGDDEDEESDDPDRLWCICKQPHNDRLVRFNMPHLQIYVHHIPDVTCKSGNESCANQSD